MSKTSGRYECKGETKGGKPSHKFWKATQSGSQVTVHFGKVDPEGQTRVIDCGTVEGAEQYLQDKIAEKLKKGYKPVKK